MRYVEIGEMKEGLRRVAEFLIPDGRLAYHWDYSDKAGLWGYLNSCGELIVPPQYIYAGDMYCGMAFVCRGEWTIDKKWDNGVHIGDYWSDVMLWGAVDENGREIIPCKFDELLDLDNDREFIGAHYGGWENGAWGIIDRKGNWLVEPVFEDLGYDSMGSLIIFYDKDKWDDGLMGVYDIKKQKVVFEPIYDTIYFDTYTKTIELVFEDAEKRESVTRWVKKNGMEIAKRVIKWR